MYIYIYNIYIYIYIYIYSIANENLRTTNKFPYTFTNIQKYHLDFILYAIC